MLVSLVLLSVYGTGLLVLRNDPANTLLVPLPAAIVAAATALSSLIAYILAPQKYLYGIAFVNYALLAATVAILIAMTGEIHSPYLVLWMLITIFAGIFGKTALTLIFIAVNSWLVYQLFTNPNWITRDSLIIFLLALETPIAVSYIIWQGKSTQESKKTKEYNALAKQLSQVANKSEIVINAIDDAVVAIDSQGSIQLINPAAQDLLGWSKQDALGLDYRSVIKLVTAQGKEVIPEASPIQQVLSSNKSIINNDLAIATNSGKKLFISLAVSPVGNENRATGAIAVFRDITDEKEEERQQAEFVSTASHEMRTPVAAIEGYLGLALNPNTATIDEKARAYLQKAHEAAQHLGGLFQDLLTVSRAEDGRLTPKPSVIDVVAFVRELTEGLLPKAQAKNLFLYFKPGGSVQETAATDHEERARTISPVFYSYVDQGHLREVVNNLIDNAIKYTKQGSVTVDIDGDESAISISIADTGIGIPPEDVPHLFQKFYRIDNSDTREIGGTGLGLYISRRLTEANNGHIRVESEYGKGSTFYVQIPRISHDRATELMQNQGQEQAITSASETMPVPSTQSTVPAGSPPVQTAPTLATAPITTPPQPQNIQPPATPLQQ